MTRKKKVIIGLIAFVAFNMYIYKGAHDVPTGKMRGLSDECQLLVGPPSRKYPFATYYIASKDDFVKELRNLNIVIQTDLQCKRDDAECFFATYWNSSKAVASVKTTVIDGMKIALARDRPVNGIQEYSDRCLEHLRDISSSNARRLESDAYARKEGYGWRNVFPPFHWYYETFLKW